VAFTAFDPDRGVGVLGAFASDPVGHLSDLLQRREVTWEARYGVCPSAPR
jgi:hypothetical protein